jgi:hypothetical protein
MKSIGDRPEWRGNLRFLRKRHHDIVIDGNRLRLRWETESLLTFDLLFHFYSCKMACDAITVSGSGESIRPSLALKKAFSESWERLWLKHPLLLKKSLNKNSSNGFAAGPTSEDATKKAEDELLERALFLKAWKDMSGWKIYKTSSRWLSFLTAKAKIEGWRLDYFEIFSKEGDRVLFLLARHQQKGAVADTQLIDFKHPQASEIKLTLSVLRSIHFCTSSSAMTISDLPAQGGPSDHAQFYKNPDHLKAFQFLENLPKNPKPLILEYKEKIFSTVLYKGGEMPAVAVADNPIWEHLSWGRNSIQGLNSYPHTLA